MQSRFFPALVLATMFATRASAAESAKPPPNQLTTGQREKLAKVAANLATCLRSEKPYDDCVRDAAKACH